MQKMWFLLFIGVLSFASLSDAVKEMESGKRHRPGGGYPGGGFPGGGFPGWGFPACNSNKKCANDFGYCISYEDRDECDGLLIPGLCGRPFCSCCIEVSLPVNECDEGEDTCPSNSVCQDEEQGYLCDCDEGFQQCGDIDECSLAPCPGNLTCVNTYGSFECVCPEGYESQDGACLDIDECSMASPCGTGKDCVNTPGSFECECAPDTKDLCVERCPPPSVLVNFELGCIQQITEPMSHSEATARCDNEYKQLLELSSTADLDTIAGFSAVLATTWIDIFDTSLIENFESNPDLCPAISVTDPGDPNLYQFTQLDCDTELESALCQVDVNWR